MALVVESVGTGTREAASADLTITKPANVAVGDLLITIIGWRSSSSRSLNTLSGWTAIQVSGSDLIGIGSFWRTATSADVSATDYTWSMSGTASYMSGAMLRISGQATGNEITGSELDTATESDTTVAFTTASAPATATSLIVMAITTLDSRSLSAYATTPSATFTERADLPLTELTFGVATAPYTGTTQITSRDFTTSGNVSATQFSVFLFVQAPVNASGTVALLTPNVTHFAGTASVGASGTGTLLTPNVTHFAVSGEATTPTQWTPASKPSTTWTPQSK